MGIPLPAVLVLSGRGYAGFRAGSRPSTVQSAYKPRSVLGPLILHRPGLFLCIAWARRGVLYIRQRSRARSWTGSFVFLYIYPTPQDVDLRHGAWWALEATLGALGGCSIQDPVSELPRIPLLSTPVNRAAQAQWWCPDSRMVAFFFLSFRAGSECNHTETCAGCIVSFTTPTRSSLNAFRSVSSRSFIVNPSSVLAASYFLR